MKLVFPFKFLEHIKLRNFTFNLQVLLSTSEKSPVILYVRTFERLLLQSERIYNLFEKLLNKLSGSILVLGSRMLDANTEYEQADEHLTKLFPYNIDIRPPQDETNLVNWNSQLEEDMKMIQFQDTRNHIAEVLAANDLVCDDLASICHSGHNNLPSKRQK
ncbi:Formin-2, partial [Bienertia sinuspersici]